jgi:hypothetical protein
MGKGQGERPKERGWINRRRYRHGVKLVSRFKHFWNFFRIRWLLRFATRFEKLADRVYEFRNPMQKTGKVMNTDVRIISPDDKRRGQLWKPFLTSPVRVNALAWQF